MLAILESWTWLKTGRTLTWQRHKGDAPQNFTSKVGEIKNAWRQQIWQHQLILDEMDCICFALPKRRTVTRLSFPRKTQSAWANIVKSLSFCGGNYLKQLESLDYNDSWLQSIFSKPRATYAACCFHRNDSTDRMADQQNKANTLILRGAGVLFVVQKSPNFLGFFCLHE